MKSASWQNYVLPFSTLHIIWGLRSLSGDTFSIGNNARNIILSGQSLGGKLQRTDYLL